MQDEVLARIQRLKARLQKVEKEQFIHHMNDHWDLLDFQINDEMNDEIKELKIQIEALEEVAK